MPQIPEYKNITATVRTPRCAILINENSKYWKAAANGVIQHASEVWGGRHFLIVPTDGTRIKDKFWEILEAYDPDQIALYNLTFSDMQDAEPARYAETKQKFRDEYAKGNYGLDFEEWFTGSADMSPIDELTISDHLEQQLINRLSPFHFQGRAVRDRLSHNAGFHYPFTKVADILGSANRKPIEVMLPRDIEDPTIALLVHSQTGIAARRYCDGLAKQGVTSAGLPATYGTKEFVRDVFSGKRQMMADASAPNPAEYMSRMPFGLSMLHLGQYYQLGRHEEEKESPVVVIGDTVDDFCLYYSLSRMHENVYWLPLSWLRDCHLLINQNRQRHQQGQVQQQLDIQQSVTLALVNLFFDSIHYGQADKRLELRSMSLTKRQLIAYRGQVADCSYLDRARCVANIDCPPIEQTSTACVLRVFEENNYTNNESVVFIDGESVSPFPTPKPKNFSPIKPSGHYWLTSLRIEGYEPPSVPSLGTEMIQMHSLANESRVAADGIAYHCPNIGYFGGDIDVVLVKPKIRLPDELTMLGAYFGSAGITISYSDKGNYVHDTIRRFGGLDEAGTFIKAATTRSILDNFLLTKNTSDGSVIYLTNDQRAYLNFKAFEASLKDAEWAVALVDELVGKHILQRGYILQCQRCRLASWYSLEVLTSDFTCNRCDFRQQFTRVHWKNPEEPHWYYKLAETVYQFYKNDSHLTVQTLYKLKSQTKFAFHYLPEIDLHGFPAPGEKREIDVACVADGRIILGECKTEQLKPSVAKTFEELVQVLGRHPDQIVFATTRAPVSDASKARIGGLPNSSILTFADLYDA
jgi:hypothetical protein